MKYFFPIQNEEVVIDLSDEVSSETEDSLSDFPFYLTIESESFEYLDKIIGSLEIIGAILVVMFSMYFLHNSFSRMR